MFERLAGKILNRFLSKYFVQNHENEQQSKSAQLSVWSGYMSFENLQFRKEVINELLRNSGVEMVSGSITSMEITVPWAKLGAASTDDNNINNDAVVVVVMDGLHFLLRTNYVYDDESLRQDAIASRRSALADSETFGRKESSSMSSLLQKRITEGILKDILEKLHIHIRDVHIRLEDVLSDPINPQACGITLESLHVQAEDERYESGERLNVIRKEGQLNHFAVYWSAIDLDEGLPVEMAVLHQQDLSAMSLGKALDKSIARRGSALALPSRTGTTYAPKHTYVLRPLDARCHVALSTKPGSLEERPSFVCSVAVDDLSIHVRDFQTAGIVALSSSMKEYRFFKKYRPYRPPQSPLESPRSWWRYAAKVVRMELRESRMRWSWSRFHQRYEMRRRYCHLYGRQCQYPSRSVISRAASSGALESLSITSVHTAVNPDISDEMLQIQGQPPECDDGALNASHRISSQPITPQFQSLQTQGGLSQQELEELIEIEDGVRGDLSTRDIILYRAIVNARLAGTIGDVVPTKKRSGLRKWIRSAAIEDAEAERECERLLAYLETASQSTELCAEDNSRVAVSIRVQLERGCVSLYSALGSTSDQERQYRRLHKRFMDISIQNFNSEVEIMGNFESYQLTISLDDFTIEQIQSSQSNCVVVSRVFSSEVESNDEMELPTNPLVYIQIMSDPPDHPEYDIGFHACFDAVDVVITPVNESLHQIRNLIPAKGEISASRYWRNVGLDQLGSLASDRAGWLGRSARSISQHKNLDLDIRINCPVFCVHGDRDFILMIDLGKAHIVTESLSGLALGKLNYALRGTKDMGGNSAASISQPSSRKKNRQMTSATERTDGSIGDSNSLFLTPSIANQTFMTFPSSPRYGIDHFMNGAASVSGSEMGRFDVRSTASDFIADRIVPARSGNSSFYDKFQLHLSKTRVCLERINDRKDEILSHFDVVATLESSVIPSDLTHCRFKAQASINDVMLSITRWGIMGIANVAHAWKRSSTVANEVRTQDVYDAPRSLSLHEELMREIKSEFEQQPETLTETSSVIDENEFLDVFEDDGETSWSNDKWALDAEAVLNPDDQSQKVSQKPRRARSISDVSSTSDGSRNVAYKRAGAVYLNAENLARLEEGGGEDEDESDLDSDCDSFHSALSFGGRIELVNTLAIDVTNAEEEVALLEKKLLEVFSSNAFSLDSTHQNLRRQERLSLKVALARAKAELRAMKASQQDLEMTVEIDVTDDVSESFVHVSKNAIAEGRSNEDKAALKAKSILRFRRQRSSVIESLEAGITPIATNVNRDFFKGSLVVKSVHIKLDYSVDFEDCASLDLQLSNVAVALSHRARDSKIFIGSDVLCLSQTDNGRRTELLRAGYSTKASLFNRALATEVDHFLRLALDLNRHGRQGASLKGRIILGGIDVSPETSLIPAVRKYAQAVNLFELSRHQENVFSGQPKPNLVGRLVNELSQFQGIGGNLSLVHDFSLRCSSFRISIWDDRPGDPLIGTIVLTDYGLRISLELSPLVTRLQLDTVCGNMQVFGCTYEAGSTPRELLGRKDHYGQIIKSRLRISSTPRTRVDGWAGGLGRTVAQEATLPPSRMMAIDCHFGIRVYPIQIVAYEDCLQRFRKMSRSSSVESQEQEHVTKTQDVQKVAMRWRIDVAVQKTIVVVPSAARLPECALQLMLSLRLSAEHCQNASHKCPVIRASLYDISLSRALDEWPILERSSLSMSVIVSHPQFQALSMLERMNLPATSFWSETESLLHECCDSVRLSGSSLVSTDRLQLQLSVSSSPIRVNVSSSVLALLRSINASWKHSDNSSDFVENGLGRKTFSPPRVEGMLVLDSPEFEVKFFKDSSNTSRGGIAFARSLFSMSIEGWFFEVFGRNEDVGVSMRVSNLMVHDLSMHPGVRVVGLDKSTEKEGSGAFLILQVSLLRQNSLPRLEVQLRWGKIQLLPLPSLVDSCMSILKDNWLMDMPKASETPSKKRATTTWPLEATMINISFDVDRLECILSSRNIFDHVRDDSEDSISVVAFRWSLTSKLFIALVRSSDSSTSDVVDYSKNVQQAKVIDALRRFSENQLHAMVFMKSQEENVMVDHASQRGVFSVHLDLQVTHFQALRTCVERAKASLSAAGDSGDTPAVFTVLPPKAGEQRITNPINFRMEYRLFGTSISASPHSGSLDDMELAHAFKLQGDKIDVLVYIRSSDGGMGDASRVTLAPIVSSLKDAQRSYQKRSSGDGKFGTAFRALIARASMVGSASVKGFQVTLVPGGATRLTESPIVQFGMKNVDVGLAVIDVPAIVDAMSPNSRGTSLLAISGALRGDTTSKGAFQAGQSVVSHATIAGWLNMDISAHYHNRSLVAWEPLIEHWTAFAKCGVDLVRVLDFAPSLRQSAAVVGSKKVKSMSAMNFVPDAGDRLRDFGKLFGSPFANKQSNRGAEMVKCTSDMPYLLLVALAPELISSALYPTPLQELDIQQESNERSVMQIPGNRRIEWLKQFGHPGVRGAEKKPLSRDPAIQLCLLDTKTLNVNVTGALIENLASYLTGSSSASAIIPHWIRNETGLTIRFLEVLDADRVRRGEQPKPTTLASGREIPLSLKRSVSQSCDPHKAQITLELGSFEETVDRVNHSKYNVSKGSRSTTFFYKAFGRIQVDAVGVHEISFYENTKLLSQNVRKQTAAVGKIIVRISLKGGIKQVSVESPMVLRNATSHDLHCEVKDRDGIVQLWSSTIPMTSEIDDESDRARATEPVPADLVPWMDEGTVSLSLSSFKERDKVDSNGSSLVCPVDPPLPYARSSISRGVIAEAELNLPMITKEEMKFIFLSACSVRLGSFEVVPASRSRANTRKQSASVVPQQRMLLLRAPIVIANHLPVLMHIQVRRKVQAARVLQVSTSNLAGMSNASASNLAGMVPPMENHKKAIERHCEDEAWTDLGIVSCGKSVRWTGAQASQEVEVRVKLLDGRDSSSEQFPFWSTAASIFPDATSKRDRDAGEALSDLTLVDERGSSLSLSVHVRAGLGGNENDDFGVEDVRSFASLLDQAHRVISVSVPYWIVDSSGLELEFSSDKPIAGQVTRSRHMLKSQSWKAQSLPCLGLAGIARNDQLCDDRAQQSFEVLMIGHLRASRLTMRQRQIRFHQDDFCMSQYTSSWCEPFSLHTSENTFWDVTVQAPSDFSDHLEPSALRYEIVRAPTKCGGLHGTKIVHIFSRYKIINEMGRDIEIVAGLRQDEPITIEATGFQVPFHFDDSSPIRFRPKEFGWLWSGKITTVKKRREVTIRLVHRLRRQIIIATVECLTTSKSPSNILVFRNASQPPFRLENHTMFAIRYGQSSKFRTRGEDLTVQPSDHSLDNILLQYQHVDFAWDEPDEGRRSISIELGETGGSGRPVESKILGSFALEKIAPGSKIQLSSRDIVGEIVADGPTRVLRLTDANVPVALQDDDPSRAITVAKKETGWMAPSSVEIRLLYGIGISVVDWSPKELLYVSMDDIVLERSIDETHERFNFTVGHLSVDNQLWVTPYPVLLKVGRKLAGRRRRNQALELAWTRAIAKQGDFTLLTNLDLSIDPITVQVDGAVVNHVLDMITHPVIDKQSNAPRGDNWLEAEIRRVLRMDYSSEGKRSPFPQSNPHPFPFNETNFLATAAAAAKINHRSGLLRLHMGAKYEPQKLGSHQRRSEGKLHINKLRISNVKTDISWSGALPTLFVGLPGLLRPALTFESLPVVLGSYTAYHVYGTAQDIADGFKHHYISVWRVVDTMIGLAFKPLFLCRAILYTTTESFASFLERASQLCSVAEDIWLDNMPHDKISKSTRTTSLVRKDIEQVTGLSLVLLRIPILLMASSSRTWGLIFSSFASSLRYGEPDGILASRTRNPRLFAHVDGKDLLVEYVEGENAGKALLSRVRAGQHLGEGYVFHAENVHLSSSNRETQSDANSTPLIIMVTSERVLLLNGERNANFCHVIWEALLDNMVGMELDDADGSFFYLAKFWYLIDTEHSKGNFDERLSRHANVIVTDADLGLCMLTCKSFYVPQDLAKTLQYKVTSVHKGMEDSLSSSHSFIDFQTSMSDKV